MKIINFKSILVCLVLIYALYFVHQVQNSKFLDKKDSQSIALDDQDDWKLIFQDEFEDKQVEESKWTKRYRTHGNTEQQLYIEDDIYTENGNLVIRTRYNPTIYNLTGKLYNFTSGWLDSSQKFNFSEGRFEARVKLPKTKVNDPIWPALWTIGDGVSWLKGGEIDIFEMNSNWNGDKLPHLYGTYHWGNNASDNHCHGCGTIYPNKINLNDYHVFRFDWNATQFDWYIDNIHYKTNEQGVQYPKTDAPITLPTYPQFIIINTAIDDFVQAKKADYPKYMYIDYIRVYQKKNTQNIQN
ncbi:hypothetical protein ABPG74_003959 [Tetrahymena malaccensis]